MKKFLTTVLALTLALSLVACGGKNNAANNDTDNSGSNITNNETVDNGGKDETPETPEEPEASEAPDLNQYYEDFMASLSEENRPAMMDLEAEMADQVYAGISGYETKQMVLKTAAISMVASEFALVEVANEADAAAVAEIFQARVDYQIESGAFYPATVAAWEQAEIITNGSVVALIVAGEQQAAAVDAFNALFA